MEMARTCNHRVFRPGLIASIRASKPGLFANEPAFIWFDLQSTVMNRNYLQVIARR
ncbi:putative transposase [Pseudomonas savastanoi pv. glycinea]|nr:putative transposase [Pseudomonas savastanoi pv. glycinea]